MESVVIARDKTNAIVPNNLDRFSDAICFTDKMILLFKTNANFISNSVIKCEMKV